MKRISTSLSMLFLLSSGLMTGCATLGYAEPPVVEDISVANIFNVDQKRQKESLSENSGQPLHGQRRKV